MNEQAKKYSINLANIYKPWELFTDLKSAGVMREEHGDNLDALYDVLTAISEPTELIFSGLDDLESEMRDYLGALRQVCEDAESENPNFSVSYD